MGPPSHARRLESVSSFAWPPALMPRWARTSRMSSVPMRLPGFSGIGSASAFLNAHGAPPPCAAARLAALARLAAGAHAAGADDAEDFVGSETLAGGQRHGLSMCFSQCAWG